MNGKQQALKTFIEQTKLLVTLASGFILAPATALSFFGLHAGNGTVDAFLPLFWRAETLLIASVLFGYLVLASIAGSQHDDHYNVYRPATRILSILQFLSYLAGVVAFLLLIRNAASTRP